MAIASSVAMVIFGQKQFFPSELKCLNYYPWRRRISWLSTTVAMIDVRKMMIMMAVVVVVVDMMMVVMIIMTVV